jgi:nicotinate phosphoribosyltransferase
MAHSSGVSRDRSPSAPRVPAQNVLLIDTYDTIAGARRAVAKEMEAQGRRLNGVRLDSGDVVALSREVRGILDDAGLRYVKIFVSGGLDEESIDQYLAAGAPIDAFGVGTRMDVSADAPSLDMAYPGGGWPSGAEEQRRGGTWAAQKQVWFMA